MNKHFSFGLLLVLLLSAPINADVFWLNIPSAFSKTEEHHIPSMSFPMQSHDACSDAIVEYAKTNLVHYIGCDVKPLPDAVNLTKARAGLSED